MFLCWEAVTVPTRGRPSCGPCSRNTSIPLEEQTALADRSRQALDTHPVTPAGGRCNTECMADLDPLVDASPSRPTVKGEVFGSPRHTRAAQFSAVRFGLLLVASLAISSLSAAEVAPGLSMTMAGLMVLCGFAELIDSSQRSLVIGLRFGGAATALFGLLLQL